jgi:hypothetical protein
MKSRLAFVVFFAVMIAAVAALWWRMQQLESKVAGMEKQLQTHSGMVSLRMNQSNGKQPEGKHQIFRLIDSVPAQRNVRSTDVGVPWDVERAMMGDAMKNDPARFTPSRIEAPPEGQIIDPSGPPRMDLDFIPKEPGPN